MRQRILPVLRLLVVAGLCLTSVEAQSSYDDYQKALRAERSEGDLEKAIGLYEQVVTKADSRSLAARAQLRIGMCYEKMGLEDAVEAYRTVIQAYPRQEPVVKIARERLEALAKAAERTSLLPRFRTIQIPGKLEYNSAAQLSPDGQQLAFFFQGAIWCLPVEGQVDPDIAGRPVQLTDPVGAWGYGLSWSADGQWIAFGGKELYVARTDDGTVAEIPVRRELSGDAGGWGISLSPDGSVLAYSSAEEEKSYIYTVPVAGGIPLRVTENWAREPAFSPDGSLIAYVKIHKPFSDEEFGEIWVIPAAGGTAVRLIGVPGVVRSPLWSPDGSMVAFLRKLEAAKGGIGISFVSVSPSGESLERARTLELPRTTHHLLAGWTPDDRIGIRVATPEYRAVYTVPSSGGKAVQVSPSGLAYHPRWTPDGQRIYFRWARGYVAFVPAEGGSVSVLEMPVENRIVEVTSGGGNVVSPDGSTLVFAAYQERVSPLRVQLWRMPVEGGIPTELTQGPRQDRFPCWSPDSETIAFVRASAGFNIWLVSAHGGEAELLTAESDQVAWSPIRWSPDGSMIAYFSKDDSLRVISVPGGQCTEVIQVPDRSIQCELTWSPASDEIAYTSEGRISRVSLSDGIPRQVEIGFEWKAEGLDWSADGETIAFTAATGGETALVLMEDFLPLLNSR